jgi:hypothetical protein
VRIIDGHVLGYSIRNVRIKPSIVLLVEKLGYSHINVHWVRYHIRYYNFHKSARMASSCCWTECGNRLELSTLHTLTIYCVILRDEDVESDPRTDNTVQVRNVYIWILAISVVVHEDHASTYVAHARTRTFTFQSKYILSHVHFKSLRTF